MCSAMVLIPVVMHSGSRHRTHTRRTRGARDKQGSSGDLLTAIGSIAGAFEDDDDEREHVNGTTALQSIRFVHAFACVWSLGMDWSCAETTCVPPFTTFVFCVPAHVAPHHTKPHHTPVCTGLMTLTRCCWTNNRAVLSSITNQGSEGAVVSSASTQTSFATSRTSVKVMTASLHWLSRRRTTMWSACGTL